MVKVIDYVLRQNHEGKSFYALTLQGGLEIVESVSGGSYLTAKKCSIPTTFNEATCAALLGQELPGTIKKIENVDPYEYVVPSTGEVLLLTHSYQYVREEESKDVTSLPHAENTSGQLAGF